MAERRTLCPLLFGVGLRDARVFVDALDGHFEVEGDFALVGGAGNGGGGGGFGGAGEGDVAFAGEQAGGRVEADPAGAGEVDFGPGVEVGEVAFRAGGAVERLDVGGQLDQVARDEAGGESEVAGEVDEKPGEVAAGAAAELEGFFGGLDAGLHADEVLERLVDGHVQFDDVVDHPDVFAAGCFDQFGEEGAGLLGFEVGCEFFLDDGVVGEWVYLRGGFDEEVERVDDGHVGDEVDFDFELGGLFQEDEAGEVVGIRVLLPVEEVLLRIDPERVGQDGGAGVRGRAEAHGVRAHRDGPVIFVAGDVIQRNANGHANGSE